MSSSSDVLKRRLRLLGDEWHNPAGKCVLYVMSRDQRVDANHALIAAQKHAIAHKLPLAVVFCISPNFKHRAREHMDFMLDGLRDVEQRLETLNIPFLTLIGNHTERLEGIVHHTQPAAVYVDMNPLSFAQKWQSDLAKLLPVIQVDTHNIVPVWIASDKQEVGARTLRPKIHKLLNEFLYSAPIDIPKRHPYSWPGPILPLSDLVDKMQEVITEYIPNNTHVVWAPGETAARVHLEEFIGHRLAGYATDRNNPTIDGLSNLSPYLHFGHISSLQVMDAVLQAVAQDGSLQASADVLLEEMVIRKELSDNYCFYNTTYNSIAGAPQWAQATLIKHTQDIREYLYTLEEFEVGSTHDEAWNAAQIQLRASGKIHGYMRMYWAKKVLEWSASPEEALRILTYLNDFYSIDGGDPSGYVGILWSIAGLHDRPWGERPVYGTVRSMVYNGLKRKFDIEQYILHNS